MCGPGPLWGPMLAVLGRSWDLCWRSWAAFGPLWAVLRRSWDLCARSWVALGADAGGLGPLLGRMLPVSGRSWTLCRRSWAALGPYVGGLGPLLGPKLAVLAALGASEGGLGAGSKRKATQSRKSDPNLSGSRVQKKSGPPRRPKTSEAAGPPTYFVLYIFLSLIHI